MLERARQLARDGRAVYVVAANQHHARQIKQMLGSDESGGIKIESIVSLGNSFDWETLTLRGAHPNCVVMVDHQAIESRYSAILDEWTRYDLGSLGTKERAVGADAR
jgi:hypothetical protein